MNSCETELKCAREEINRLKIEIQELRAMLRATKSTSGAYNDGYDDGYHEGMTEHTLI